MSDIPNHEELILSDLLPKKYNYGQCIIYNKTQNMFLKDAVWLEKPHLP